MPRSSSGSERDFGESFDGFAGDELHPQGWRCPQEAALKKPSHAFLAHAQDLGGVLDGVKELRQAIRYLSVGVVLRYVHDTILSTIWRQVKP